MKTDPLTGIKIVYDKRIKVGYSRWDNKGRFLRMNPKTKPTLERGIAYANAQHMFKRLDLRGYYSPQVLLNPPILLTKGIA